MDIDAKIKNKFNKVMNPLKMKENTKLTIDDLFGTLQHSVVATWRKHLRSAKYSKHTALDEFYKKMPDKVDTLIEVWMGVKGHKINGFNNVIQSKNLNTIKYLQELRQVVKKGYDLMDGVEELEACLDDIAALIDSTLYKVKELSENKIIDLKDFINESLLVEGSTDYAFVWDHYNPETIYCLNGATSKLKKELKNSDYNIEIHKIPSNICSIMWNDEYMALENLDGNNLNSVKSIELKNLQSQIDSTPEDEEDPYICLECHMFCGANEWYDEDAESRKAEDYLDRFIEMIEDSEVDGDSGHGRAVIDVKKGEVLLSGSVDVVFQSANEFLENHFGK